MTPTDRNKNRYMVNSIDHASNYCRIFVAETKDQAAKMFEYFLAHFERMFNRMVHVLLTDRGCEYKCVEFFCKSTGVIRQVREANNQTSNGKAELIHRTVLKMARSMIIESGLTLYFWGDAVHYATYVLNLSPSSAKRNVYDATGDVDRRDFQYVRLVLFDSPCTIYRNPNKTAWKPRADIGIIFGNHDET